MLGSISDPNILNAIGVEFYKGNTSEPTANALRARLIGLGVTPAFQYGGITSGPSLAGEAGPEAVIPLPGGRAVPVSFGSNLVDTVKQLHTMLQVQTQKLADLTAASGQMITDTVKTGNTYLSKSAHATQLAAANPIGTRA